MCNLGCVEVDPYNDRIRIDLPSPVLHQAFDELVRRLGIRHQVGREAGSHPHVKPTSLGLHPLHLREIRIEMHISRAFDTSFGFFPRRRVTGALVAGGAFCLLVGGLARRLAYGGAAEGIERGLCALHKIDRGTCSIGLTSYMMFVASGVL